MVHLIKDPTLHSEIVAIREACRVLDSLELTGCDVYAISHPCPMCLGALYFAKPRAVFFAQSMEDKMRLGFGKGDLYSQFALPFDKRDLPMVQISQRLQEANDVFVKYQQMHP
jgi:guanine deaminase